MGKKGYAVEGNTITDLDAGTELGSYRSGSVQFRIGHPEDYKPLKSLPYGLGVDNPSGIQPTEFRVLVKPDPVEEKTAGGIIIPDQIKEREKFAGQKATLVAVSPAAFSYDDQIKSNAPRPGDRVVIAKYAGFDIKGSDGVEYRLIDDKQVVAVLV